MTVITTTLYYDIDNGDQLIGRVLTEAEYDTISNERRILK